MQLFELLFFLLKDFFLKTLKGSLSSEKLIYEVFKSLEFKVLDY